MYQQFVIANCCPAAAKTQAYQLATSQKSWGIYLQKARDVTPLVHVVQHSHRNSNGVCSVILQLRPKFARIAPLCKDSKIHLRISKEKNWPYQPPAEGTPYHEKT